MDPPLNHGTFSRQPQEETWKHVALLSFQTLGVVYGHLSTAPLYVFGTIPREDFVSDETPYEFFSFIFWTITVISLLKYALIVLIADDDGEGGTFALYSLLCRHAKVGLLPNDQFTDKAVRLVETPSKMKLGLRARRALEKHRFSHYLMLFLALFGSSVGSQASITASFSIINQLLALNCFPKVKVVHTSDKIHGQVYIPDLNWLLMVLSLSVTIGFHKVEAIGYATGSIP
ncbi:hypothetical protein NL676_021937 [Syzygium grande]|nr:hypothetical protein NL676_021937 [Syzygium grande]